MGIDMSDKVICKIIDHEGSSNEVVEFTEIVDAIKYIRFVRIGKNLDKICDYY